MYVNAKPVTSQAEAVVVAKVSASALLAKAKATDNPVKRRATLAHHAATMTAAHATARAAMAQAMVVVVVVVASIGPNVTHQATRAAHAVTVRPEAHVKTVARVKTALNANQALTPTWAACASASHA